MSENHERAITAINKGSSVQVTDMKEGGIYTVIPTQQLVDLGKTGETHRVDAAEQSNMRATLELRDLSGKISGAISPVEFIKRIKSGRYEVTY